MLFRPHGLVPGKRLAILTALLLLVALIFFLANPIIARNHEPFEPGRDGQRIRPASPVASVAVEPEPESEPEPELPEPPRRIPSGPRRGVGFLYADEEGVVLSKERPNLESPDGQSELMLQRDGNLVLRSRGADGAPNILWSTGTGDGRAATSRDVRIALRPDGHPVLKVSATIDGKQSTLWHSDLLPACASQPKLSDSTTASPPRLGLTSTGRLSLSDTCDIYAPPNEHETARSLALIISGTYATNKTLCARSLLAQGPFASVDVFAHVSYEGADDVKGKIEDELKDCYGEELRVAVVSPASEVDENYPGGAEDERLGVCHGEANVVNTRLKGLYNVGRAWWEWSAENGILHDTVLALRADGASDAEVPRFRALDELRDTLVMTRSRDGGYAYCPRMAGGVGIAPSDYIMYGTPATMSHYLNLYQSPSLLDMVRLAGVDGAARRGFFGCQVMPSGPRPEDCPKPVCAVECLVAWYLDSVGVGTEVEWW